MIKKITVTMILALIAVICIFFGATMQRNHSEKYVRTKAMLVYEKKHTKMPSDFTYAYSADGKTYTAFRTGSISLSERSLSYNKAVPSIYYFGHVAFVTKLLLFIGTLFAMITTFFLFGVIFELSFADKLLPFIFLYYVVGTAFLTESLLATILIALFTVMIIAVCVSVKKSRENEYY